MLNITNRTPLAGVKLFESSTYPTDIDLYWRDNSPISFELSDNPDRGQMYHNFLAHIQSQLCALNIQYFQHDESRLITAEIMYYNDCSFWAIMDYDVITLYRTKPILPPGYEEKPYEVSKYLAEVFLMNVDEAVLATSFSPVDLAWLLGDYANRIGFYEERIWEAARRRLPVTSWTSSEQRLAS